MRGAAIGLFRTMVLFLCSAAFANAGLAGDGGRDIIRLLPPGPTPATPSTPAAPTLPIGPGQAPVLPFPPSANIVPQPQRLSGSTVKIPVKLAASPADPSAGFMGVRVDAITGEELAKALGVGKQPAIFVVDTTPGAAAAQAGLRFGDFVLDVDGAPVAATDQFVNSVKTRTPGTETVLTVWRVGEDGTSYLKALRELGDKGNIAVMLFIAKFYSAGIGVRRDQAEAVTWYKKAALAGSTNGMLLYGDALATGNGTVRDPNEARSWLKKASDAGNAAASWRLGIMYRDGESMEKDPLEAMGLFKRAAETNYTPAMVAIGFMYEGGGGIEADHLQAVYWYKKAADAGDAEGMAVLGTKYYSGRGVERNYATAATWYTQGAKRGQLLAIHSQ